MTTTPTLCPHTSCECACLVCGTDLLAGEALTCEPCLAKARACPYCHEDPCATPKWCEADGRADDEADRGRDP